MASKADSYMSAKIEQLDDQATFRVYGRAVDFDLGDAARRWKPVVPCLCVHDSPENPCPCPKKFVWWLWSDKILAEGDAGRKDRDGNELRYFDVLVESKILVESVQSVDASTLKNLGDKISPEAIAGITDRQGAGGGLGTIALMGLDDMIAAFLIGLAANYVWDKIKNSDEGISWAEYCRQHPDNPFCKAGQP